MSDLDMDGSANVDRLVGFDELTEFNARYKAQWAGMFLLLATVGWAACLGMVGSFFVDGSVPLTAANLLGSPRELKVLIGLSVLSSLQMIFAIGILGAVLEAVNGFWSRLAMYIGIATSVVSMGSSLLLFAVQRLLVGTPYPFTFRPQQMQGFAYMCLDVFDMIYRTSVGFTGLYYLIIGFVAYRSRLLPRWVGMVAMIGGIGWAMDIYPDIPENPGAIAFGVGLLVQLFFAGRLWLKGIDEARWQELTKRRRPRLAPPAPSPDTMNSVATLPGLRLMSTVTNDQIH